MRKAITVLLVGCSTPTIQTPGSCGLWDEVETRTPRDGECSWFAVIDNRGAVRTDDSCPDGADRCAVATTGETVHYWAETVSGSSIQEFRFELDGDECPVSCDWTGPCAPFHDVCIPCPPGVRNAMTPEGEVACEGL